MMGYIYVIVWFQIQKKTLLNLFQGLFYSYNIEKKDVANLLLRFSFLYSLFVLFWDRIN